MLRGIYTSCTGMVAEMDRQNVTANNLANINTIGFKRDNCTTVPFAELFLNAYSKHWPPQQVGKLGLGVQAVTQVVDFSSGAVSQTDNPTDFAIDGDAMFALQTKNGVRYTRAGAFQLDKDHYLVNKDGYKILGSKGPIQITGNFSVTQEGQIMQNGQVVDSFQLFSTKDMKKQGDTQYTNDQAVPAGQFRILQGALEHSNVNPVREMVQMINITRTYDANQKALTSHDETLDKLVNELAK